MGRPGPAPVSGEIVAVNDALTASPSLINSDPYGAGWVARLRPSDWDADVADLVTGPEGIEAYRGFLDAQGITCGEPRDAHSGGRAMRFVVIRYSNLIYAEHGTIGTDDLGQPPELPSTAAAIETSLAVAELGGK